MDWLSILNEIFTVCIVPLLGVLTTYLVKFLTQKIEQSKTTVSNELVTKYLTILEETVGNCVTATTQTYVESLKEKNAFNADAQKEAFQQTYNAVFNILSAEAQDVLNEAVSDLPALVTQMIEAKVNSSKS